jgi:signal transduction histidine kinase
MALMLDDPNDTPLSKLLQHSGHEIRNPFNAVIGYIGMLLKQQAGPITEPQRKLLTEAQRASGRLTSVLDQISHLAKMERGEEPLKRKPSDLRQLIDEAIAVLPEQPDRLVPVPVEVRSPSRVVVNGDPARLKRALTAVLFALRRELITNGPLIVQVGTAGTEAVIAIGDGPDVEALAEASIGSLSAFDEFRGGCGLNLPIARRIIEQHQGRLYGAGPKNMASAVIRLPLI